MKLFVTKSKEEKTVEIERDITMDVDISELDENQKSDLLDELFKNMDDDDIERSIDYNDRMLRVILQKHVYIPNEKIKHMVYILEGDVEEEDLEKDLMELIKKYNLQDEL